MIYYLTKEFYKEFKKHGWMAHVYISVGEPPTLNFNAIISGSNAGKWFTVIERATIRCDEKFELGEVTVHAESEYSKDALAEISSAVNTVIERANTVDIAGSITGSTELIAVELELEKLDAHAVELCISDIAKSGKTDEQGTLTITSADTNTSIETEILVSGIETTFSTDYARISQDEEHPIDAITEPVKLEDMMKIIGFSEDAIKKAKDTLVKRMNEKCKDISEKVVLPYFIGEILPILFSIQVQ